MSDPTADVVICGAGIAGIAAAYHLAVRQGVKRVMLVDERPPLSLTSDKSAECYRNWWPGPGDAMVRFMNRSIDILEELAAESDNIFNMNRRGYLFATANPDQVEAFVKQAEEAAVFGAGPARMHSGQPGEAAYIPSDAEGFASPLTGADIITDPALIQKHFPYLTEKTLAVAHARRCGWFSAQQLGMYLLEQARTHDVQIMTGRVTGVNVVGNRVREVQVSGNGGAAGTTTIATDHFVNAAGPFLKQVGQLLGVDIPVFSERHMKMAINDHLGVIPREAPLTIWTDSQKLPWSEEERAALADDVEAQFLLGSFAGGAHGRPDGPIDSTVVLLIWTYQVDPVEPTFPPVAEPYYADIVLRGVATMVPGLAAYFERMPKPTIDGGYYTKTQENRLLACPLPVDGAYVIGALSGYGLMASSAAGELLAAYLTGGPLPEYAPAFHLSRYDDPAYQALLENWDATAGQL